MDQLMIFWQMSVTTYTEFKKEKKKKTLWVEKIITAFDVLQHCV